MTALAEGSKDATGGSAGAALNGNNTRGKGSGRSSASASVAAAPQKPHHRTAMLRAAEKKRASDAQFLGRISRTVLEGMTPDNPAARQVIDQIVLNYVKDGLWDEAKSDLEQFAQRAYIDPGYRDRMVAQIEAGRAGYATFLAQLGRS